MHLFRGLFLSLVLLLGACSMRSALNTLTSPEDRAFAEQMVEHLRRGDEAWLRQQFRPDLWEQSVKQLGEARGLYPTVPGTTEIIGFNVSTRIANGRTERDRQFTLVTHGGGRWTVTTFRTLSSGGPDQVVAWNVTPHSSEPTELAVINAWDRMVPWLWALGLLVLAGIGALVFWLVRRSQRKQANGGQR